MRLLLAGWVLFYVGCASTPTASSITKPSTPLSDSVSTRKVPAESPANVEAVAPIKCPTELAATPISLTNVGASRVTVESKNGARNAHTLVSRDFNGDRIDDRLLLFSEECDLWGRCPHAIYAGCGGNLFVPMWEAPALGVSIKRKKLWDSFLVVGMDKKNDELTLIYDKGSYHINEDSRHQPSFGVYNKEGELAVRCDESLQCTTHVGTQTVSIQGHPVAYDPKLTTQVFASAEIQIASKDEPIKLGLNTNFTCEDEGFTVQINRLPKIDNPRLMSLRVWCGGGEDLATGSMTVALLFVSESNQESKILWEGKGWQVSDEDCSASSLPEYKKMGPKHVGISLRSWHSGWVKGYRACQGKANSVKFVRRVVVGSE